MRDLQSEFDTAALKLSQEKLHFHTIQFLIRDDKTSYKYIPYGSGVLAWIQNYFLILTASHVTNRTHEENLYINTRVGIQKVEGDCVETDLKMDKLTDLSYIILDPMLGLLLSETYQFISMKQICLGHQPQEDSRYMVCGYPEKNIRIEKNTNTVYTGTSNFLLNMVSEKTFSYYKLNKEKHYALQFSGKGQDLENEEKFEKIQDPYGISGCGLWHLSSAISHGKVTMDYCLIGIMNMIRKGKYHILIGNRIEILLDGLIRNEGFKI